MKEAAGFTLTSRASGPLQQHGARFQPKQTLGGGLALGEGGGEV